MNIVLIIIGSGVLLFAAIFFWHINSPKARREEAEIGKQLAKEKLDRLAMRLNQCRDCRHVYSYLLDYGRSIYRCNRYMDPISGKNTDCSWARPNPCRNGEGFEP